MVLAQVSASAAIEDTELPLDIWHWLLVVVPIVVLLFLYVVRRWAGPEAGPVGLLLVAIIAVWFFEMPWEDLAVASGKGVWDAVPIVLVIFAALVLYRLGTAAGAFFALRRGVEQFTKNRLFLVLAFGWIFASFTQGIVGFGTPLVIVAPILLALGVKPIYAVVIPLIGHAWANFFGTLGVGWLATGQVISLDDELLTAVLTALLLFVVIFCVGVGLAWIIGRWQAVLHALPFILIQTVVLGGVQLGVVLFSPELSTFLAGSAALLTLLVLARWSRYAEPFDLDESPALEDRDDEKEESEETREPVMNMWMALAPYGILTVLSVVALTIPPVQETLERFAFGMPFPATETGFGVVMDAEEMYEPFTPLAHPSGLLLLAVLLSWALYGARGYFAKWREQDDPPPVVRTALSDGVPATTAIVIFLVLSSIYSHSGQVDVLAFGVGEVAPPPVYAFLAPVIGIVGALVTSSSTSSNILFAPMQDAVAAAHDLNQAGVIAGQSAGGSIGNVIAPVNLTLGAAAAGIAGKEGTIMRICALWLLPVALIIGALTIPMALIGS